MPLKFKYPKREEIPAEQLALYVERDGAFVLDVEGVVEKTKLEEFRNNNIDLRQKLEAATSKLTRFDGIDPEAARKLADEKKALEEQLKTGQGSDIDKVIAARLKPLQESLDAIKAEREKIERQLREKEVNQAVLGAATKRGLRPSAQDDILLRASRVIKFDNGVAKVVDASGNVRYGADAVTPMSLDAWVESQLVDAPHLFESNAGGGAHGNGSGGAGHVGNGQNPWKKETFNLTEQGRLAKSDPVRARQLAAAAGVSLSV